MWRFIKAVPRAIRQQVNSSIRPSSQSVLCEDEPEGTKKAPTVPISYLPWKQSLHGEVSSAQDRSRRQRSHPDLSWTLPNCQHGFLEAVGWGSAILLGLQLSKLFHLHTREKKRRAQYQDQDNACPVHWLRRITHATNDIPSVTSYVSSTNAPPSIDQNCSYTSKVPEDTPSGETGDDKEGLNYEGIEVESPQFNCSQLQCDGLARIADGVYDRHASPASEDPQKDVLLGAAADPVRPPAEVTLEEAMAEWCKLSAQCVVRMHHYLAFSALRRGAEREAFAEWQQACYKGDPKAHFNLALCYELGKGVAQNLSKAVDHYAIAAAGGHYVAMYNLAVYYMDGRGGLERDTVVAVGLLERAAAEGLKEAQTDLGVLVAEMDGDWQRATELFTSAAQKDDASAQYYLGMCHENGWGVPQNQERALEMYASAAAANHGPALHALGVFTEYGKGGTVVDRKAAHDLYRRAVHAGHKTADADHKRLTVQLNQERFEAEMQTAHTIQGFSPGSRRCRSSPVISHSKFSFYIRDNLLDFGLDDHDTPKMSPSAKSNAEVTFHLGDTPDTPCDVTLPLDSSGRFQLTTGGFGDTVIKEAPVRKAKPGKLKGTFGGFDPHSYKNNLGGLLEREKQQAEMRIVVCS